MIQRLLYCDLVEFARRSMQERTAGSRKPDAIYFMKFAAAHALVHRIMLAIDRQQGLALALRFGGDQLSSYYQTFLIRESNFFARFYGLIGRFQAGNAHDCADNKIDFEMSGHAYGAGRAKNDFRVQMAGFTQLL